MKVLIVSPFENPCTGRGRRNVCLQNKLISKGVEAHLWTSNFDHAKKKIVNVRRQRNLIVVGTIGYRYNISARRLLCHIQLAIALWRHLRTNDYDAYYVSSIPPELLLVLPLKKTTVDIRDIWPDALQSYGNQSLLKKAFSYYTDIIYQRTLPNVQSFIGVAQSYRSWLHRYTNREILFAPLGIRSEDVNKEEERQIEYKYAYAGGLTPQFDLSEFKDILGNGADILIIGDGPLLERYRKLFPLANFTGNVQRDVAIEFLKTAECLLMPTNKYARLPNKLFDYIAIGRDILFGKEISNDISDVISDFKFTQELGFIRLRNDQSARSLFTTTYSEKYSIEFISDCIINEVS